MNKDTDIGFKAKQVTCEKTIIYCRNTKQCGVVYGTTKGFPEHLCWQQGSSWDWDIAVIKTSG